MEEPSRFATDRIVNAVFARKSCKLVTLRLLRSCEVVLQRFVARVRDAAPSTDVLHYIAVRMHPLLSFLRVVLDQHRIQSCDTPDGSESDVVRA